jgi:hypothetical protein
VALDSVADSAHCVSPAWGSCGKKRTWLAILRKGLEDGRRGHVALLVRLPRLFEVRRESECLGSLVFFDDPTSQTHGEGIHECSGCGERLGLLLGSRLTLAYHAAAKSILKARRRAYSSSVRLLCTSMSVSASRASSTCGVRFSSSSRAASQTR